MTEGRRREFAAWPAFADPAARERVPDPQDPAHAANVGAALGRARRTAARGDARIPPRAARAARGAHRAAPGERRARRGLSVARRYRDPRQMAARRRLAARADREPRRSAGDRVVRDRRRAIYRLGNVPAQADARSSRRGASAGSSNRDAAVHLPAAAPCGLPFPRCNGAGAVSRVARDLARLRLAVSESAGRLDARLRHRRPRPAQPGAGHGRGLPRVRRRAARARHGTRARLRPQPHGRRRRRQRVVARPPDVGRGLALRRLLRRRLAPAARGAAREGAAAVLGPAVRRGARRRASCAGNTRTAASRCATSSTAFRSRRRRTRSRSKAPSRRRWPRSRRCLRRSTGCRSTSRAAKPAASLRRLLAETEETQRARTRASASTTRARRPKAKR